MASVTPEEYLRLERAARDAHVTLPAVCELPLGDIYYQVEIE
jgi:hypothetical protein